MVATALVMYPLDEQVRKGKVLKIPSVGIVLTSAFLKDTTGARSPDQTEVIEALTECLEAQRRMRIETQDEEEIARIDQNIRDLEADIQDPRKYFLKGD